MCGRAGWPRMAGFGSFHPVAAVIAMAMIASASTAAAEQIPITYTFVSPTDGHTLTGSITTDGTIGTITPSNIVSWSWTIDGTYSANSTWAGAGLGMGGSGNVVASPTTISLPYVFSINDQNNLSMWCPNLNPTYALPCTKVNYLVDYYPAGEIGPTDSYDNQIQGFSKPADTNDWADEFGQISTYQLEPPSNPFIIATASPTPEPSTLVLLGIGAVSLLAYAWRRRVTGDRA